MNEPIKHIFSNNKKIGSKIIGWSTKNEFQKTENVPSHYSLLLFDWLILESTLLSGVRVRLYEEFKQENNIIVMFYPKDEGEKHSQFRKAKSAAKKYFNSTYDLLGALYLGVSEILNSYLNIALPKRNLLNSKAKFYCNELYEMISGKDMQMKHPNGLMLEMFKDLELQVEG